MKNKKPFGKSLTFLIVGILVVLAFIKGDKQIWFLGGVFAIWGIWMLRFVLFSIFTRIKERSKNKKIKSKSKRNNSTNESDPADVTLLRHVNCRISEYLKSIYPDVTWEWCSEEPDELATEGGTGRIRLYGITDFNYADVTVDEYANMDFNLINIVPFANLNKNGGEPKPTQNNQPANPETWYNIQGKKILEACIADLNSRGYSNLIIKENGDICIKQDDKEVVKDNFKNLPGKNAWQGLVKIIENNGLGAAITGNTIKVSW
jgi:hypothetical protein